MSGINGNPPPVKTATIGGVRYNTNQFDASVRPDGRYQLRSKSTGEILIFPQQSTTKTIPGTSDSDGVTVETSTMEISRNAHVFLDIREGYIWDDAEYTAFNIDGLEFKSSKQAVSKIKLLECDNSTVDLSANNSRHYGDKAFIIGGQGNEVKMDKHDSVSFDSGGKASGEGTAAQDDYIQDNY